MFRERADIVKLLLVIGLLSAPGALSLALPSLLTDVWGDNMSRNRAVIDAVKQFLIIIFAPAFGRWSDRRPRKLALLLSGTMHWLPSLGILVFGWGGTGLWVAVALSILAAPLDQGQTLMVAYLNDLTSPDERVAVIGIGSVAVMVVLLLYQTTASVFVQSFSWPLAAGAFDLVSFVPFVLLLFLIENSGDPKNRDDIHIKTFESVSATEELGHSHELRQPSDARAKENKGSTMRTIHFLCSDATLRNLAVINLMLTFPETVDGDVQNQFVFNALGIFHGDAGIHAKQKRVTAMMQLSFMLAQVNLIIIAGISSKVFGPLRVVRWLLPLTALAQLTPLLLLVNPADWVVVLQSVLGALKGTVMLPLQMLVSLAAPPGRTGEAVAAIEACNQLGPFLGNIMMPPLLAYFGTESLWVFFVIACLLIFTAVPFALDLTEIHDDKFEDLTESDSNDEPVD